MTLPILIIAFVTLQRLAELVLARHNTALLRGWGAYEVGARHYPLIVLLHAGWLAGLWYAATTADLPTDFGWLAAFAVLQLLRIWVIATLGPRWTTRIMVLPGAPLVSGGPYRFLSHPNYCVVAAEILILPLVFGLVWYGVAFSILNALVLALRIHRENTALRS
jgi:methyltransferase